MTQSRLHIVPVPFAVASLYVRQLHRHHPASKGHKFSVGVADEKHIIRGVACVGRPVARHLDTGANAEVTRLATDGCPNACSALYGACARIAREMGFERIYTYILESEPGTSLRAAGWRQDCAATGGQGWDMPGRERCDRGVNLVKKQRWSLELRGRR